MVQLNLPLKLENYVKMKKGALYQSPNSIFKSIVSKYPGGGGGLLTWWPPLCTS